MKKIKALSIIMCVLLTVSLLASCAASNMADKDMAMNDVYYEESFKGSA